MSQGSLVAAACVYSLLDAAAQAEAWDEPMPNNIGVYRQNWMLSGTCAAYHKVRDSGAATPGQDAQIQRWFQLVAGRVREYFDAQRNWPGSDAWNNYMYWAGLAVAIEGIADNDRDALIWGLAAYGMGIDAIEPDDSRAAEMSRAHQALHYQVYALDPLVMLAELGEANDIPMYAMKHGAIHLLVAFDIAAMRDPSILARRTATAQDAASPYSGLEIGWAVPLCPALPACAALRLDSPGAVAGFLAVGLRAA